MGRSTDGQSDCVGDGFAESGIRTVTEYVRLASIVHEVLYVRQLVMCVDQIVACDLRALFNSVIITEMMS